MGAMAIRMAAKTRRLSRADVDAACRGDREARSRVAHGVYDRVRTTVFYLTGGGADAEDIVQQALIEILGSLRTYRGEASLEVWADRIAVRTAMRDIKKRRRRRELVLSQMEEDEARAGLATDAFSSLAGRREGSPDRQTAENQIRHRLAALLRQMPVERQVAVVLRWVHGYSIEEIANITGVRVNTARGRLRKGKKELRQLILSDPTLRNWAELVMP